MMIDERVRMIRATLSEPHQGSLGDVDGLSPQDWAAVLARLHNRERLALLDRLPDDIEPKVVAELNPSVAGQVVSQLQRADAARLLQALRPDDAADIIASVPADAAESILGAMEPRAANELRQLLAYPPDTAGGRMTPAFVAVAPDLRADDAIRAIRHAASQAETIYYVYVVDDAGQFVGVLSLGELMLAQTDATVRELMLADPVSVRVDTDQEVAARLLIRRNLLAVPVLEGDDRLVGILTEDDVADVLEEEATEDIERLGGSQPLETPYRHASIPLLFRKRIVWLLALFVAEAYTGTVMRFFENELEQVVALAFFIPLLLGTGGNVGSQITTTLVRAMAVGEIALRDIRWVLAKEAGVGIVIGAVMAVVAFARAEILGVGSDVAMVVAIAIAVISIWSSVVAAMLPLVLRRLRFDPTVVSAPFITTLVDGTGLVIYFTIAKIVLEL